MDQGRKDGWLDEQKKTYGYLIDRKKQMDGWMLPKNYDWMDGQDKKKQMDGWIKNRWMV